MTSFEATRAVGLPHAVKVPWPRSCSHQSGNTHHHPSPLESLTNYHQDDLRDPKVSDRKHQSCFQFHKYLKMKLAHLSISQTFPPVKLSQLRDCSFYTVGCFMQMLNPQAENGLDPLEIDLTTEVIEWPWQNVP